MGEDWMIDGGIAASYMSKRIAKNEPTTFVTDSCDAQQRFRLSLG